jgi:Rps23 Pro-64 3,4-dihydroxylase Tpa1-like proline 4-hydroxylase
MTPKQILDSFSETLMRDERILSGQERALLSTLLQHAKAATGENRQTQDAVRAVIASAVGEIVAQRAFTVLGGSIVERIVEGTSPALFDTTAEQTSEYLGPKEPQTPTHSPIIPKQPSIPKQPGIPREPGSPGSPVKVPDVVPIPPGQPQTPSGIRTTVVSSTSVAVADRPETLPAQCVVLDEFLAPQELAELTQFTLDHEADFQVSEVLSANTEEGVVNYDHRRSRVLMDVARHQDVMLERIKAALPRVLEKLGMEEFPITAVEAQITASNDGDFFHFHSDNGSDPVASRQLTFVYFFHREPRSFEGGELRIHDARLENGGYVSQGSYQTIAPQQNQIVLFPCELMHEITAVKCPSQRFADSRFTMNGWLRR